MNKLDMEKGGPGSGPRPGQGRHTSGREDSASYRSASLATYKTVQEEIRMRQDDLSSNATKDPAATKGNIEGMKEGLQIAGKAGSLSEANSKLLDAIREKSREAIIEGKRSGQGARDKAKAATGHRDGLERVRSELSANSKAKLEKGGPGSGPRPGQGRHEGGGKESSTGASVKAVGNQIDAKIKEFKADENDPKAGDLAKGLVAGYQDAKTAVTSSNSLKEAYDKLDAAAKAHEKFGNDVKAAGGTLADSYTGKALALDAARRMVKEALKSDIEKYDRIQLNVIKACTPGPNESEDKFVGRCIGEMVDSGRDQDQAAAICYSKWRGKVDKANSRTVIMSPEPDESQSDFMDRCVAYHTGRGDPEANAERVCGTMWDNKSDQGSMGVDVASDSSLSGGFMEVKRP